MPSCRTILACLPGSVLLFGCSTAPDSPDSVAAALVEAFNAHDPAAMAALVTDDFELYYVGDDGVATLTTTGCEALRQEMVEYFEAQPTVQSELEGELLRRVWYFRSEP